MTEQHIALSRNGAVQNRVVQKMTFHRVSLQNSFLGLWLPIITSSKFERDGEYLEVVQSQTVFTIET